MGLSKLAEISDVENRLGRQLSADQTAKVSAALADASAVVRTYTRRTFTRQTSTVRIRPRGRKVILPQRPVISVDEVNIVWNFAGTDTITPTPAYSYAGGAEVVMLDPSVVINGPTLDMDDDNVWVEVVYTHGYESVPEDIVTVVANMVVRSMSLPGGGLIDSESIGPYTTRYAGHATAGPLALADGERRILNAYRSTGRSVELR